MFQQLVLGYRRGAVEVTLAEAYLGMEAQRRWSTMALARMTPALLGWSIGMTLLAEPRRERRGATVPQMDDACWT